MDNMKYLTYEDYDELMKIIKESFFDIRNNDDDYTKKRREKLYYFYSKLSSVQTELYLKNFLNEIDNE